MNKLLLVALFMAGGSSLAAAVLPIGPDQTYANLEAAARRAQPGDTLLFHPGRYPGEQSVIGLQGRAGARIYIIAAASGSVVISGGRFAWHLSDPAYLTISGFTFEGQTQNGLNIDDGGDYTDPAHHIELADCRFRDLKGRGNNDLLKLSGLDHFSIDRCQFTNGADGGSGIDLVGCHDGTISASRFENMGSNSIQVKGGSARISIERNHFRNGGLRTLNLGGSTGLPYFRPSDATYEAADLQVYANLIVGSDAAIAYVGAVRVKVINNTIILPSAWVLRILQETVDPGRFVACGDNVFANNLIYYGPLRTEVNTGAHTRPESFDFSDNYWYRVDDPGREPQLPATSLRQQWGKDPQFADLEGANYQLKTASPVRHYISGTTEPKLDFLGRPYGKKRAAGAFAAP
ncbi:right-handed parallel beta-helix repeat-containing protein [Flavilitoribacter nigricans]|uniref:Right handed beta helix domain-containing protein n=1 Tax=Flavilitoribacter nigricans (strain ATCC 23147 / DSM 23189 / NBRC 102662 / NCIMB 1420 / SS-2) TaxID=1122177 RepID=A0A2D0NHB3_FLAN2|nr:right-handed parallel beta-helix repeat-containing protein [Flavilitoribacter nigricans]PHN07875.1 hypothetical protein CRP01_03745 [Flavilitoribacter nigricans DSM 23189 = NBRC 102662]